MSNEKTFTNKRDGIRSHVERRPAGYYAVSLEDVDAEEFLPTIKVFSSFDQATTYAMKIVRGEGC